MHFRSLALMALAPMTMTVHGAAARPLRATMLEAPATPIPYPEMNSYMAARGEVMNGDAPAMPEAGGTPRRIKTIRMLRPMRMDGPATPGMNGDAPAMVAAAPAPHRRLPEAKGRSVAPPRR